MTQAQMIYALLGQKGGGGKSTTAYGLATILAGAGQKVLIADLDFDQYTCALWKSIRPEGRTAFDVIECRTLADVGKNSAGYDVIIIDGAPHASKLSLEAAECAHRVIITTGNTVADLQPSVRLARNLVTENIERERIVFAVCKSPSEAETKTARETIEGYGFAAAPIGLRFSAGYGKAGDKGLSITETPFVSLRVEAKAYINQLILEA